MWTRQYAKGLLVKLMTTSCEGCSGVIHQKQGRGAPRRFCSKECRYKAYYALNKEKLQKAALAHYYKDREPLLKLSRSVYKEVVKPGIEKIDVMFSLLSEHERTEYAEWLLFIAGQDSRYSRMVHTYRVDSWLAEYAVSAG